MTYYTLIGHHAEDSAHLDTDNLQADCGIQYPIHACILHGYLKNEAAQVAKSTEQF